MGLLAQYTQFVVPGPGLELNLGNAKGWLSVSVDTVAGQAAGTGISLVIGGFRVRQTFQVAYGAPALTIPFTGNLVKVTGAGAVIELLISTDHVVTAPLVLTPGTVATNTTIVSNGLSGAGAVTNGSIVSGAVISFTIPASKVGKINAVGAILTANPTSGNVTLSAARLSRIAAGTTVEQILSTDAVGGVLTSGQSYAIWAFGKGASGSNPTLTGATLSHAEALNYELDNLQPGDQLIVTFTFTTALGNPTATLYPDGVLEPE